MYPTIRRCDGWGHTFVSPNAARPDRSPDRGAFRTGAGRARRQRRRRSGRWRARGDAGGRIAQKRKRGRCCHRPRFGFRPGSCDPGRFPIERPLKQAPTGFSISGPIEASSERSLCGSFARRLQFRRTPGKVGSDLGCPASSRFFPGCPTTASTASVPKDIRRFRGGGTQKLSSVSGRPLLTAKCQYGRAIPIRGSAKCLWITRITGIESRARGAGPAALAERGDAGRGRLCFMRGSPGRRWGR